MKLLNIKTAGSVLVLFAVCLAGCYKLQKDYEYVKTELDPHIDKSAKEYILSRSDSVRPGAVDTTFRWMKKAIEYSGIDWSEYEKPNRTYLLLNNAAVRSLTGSGASATVTGGFFFDYPVIVK